MILILDANSIIYTTDCHIQFNCTHFCMHIFFLKLKICMDNNLLHWLFPDFFQKTSNFPDFSWSSNKFPDFPEVEILPFLVEIPRSKTKTHQGVIQKNFFCGGSPKKCDHDCDQLRICIEYTYVSEFILCVVSKGVHTPPPFSSSTPLSWDSPLSRNSRFPTFCRTIGKYITLLNGLYINSTHKLS